MKQETLEEVAERIYREFPTNPKDKPDWHYNKDIHCFKKRKAFVNGAKYMSERMYSEEDMIAFSEWRDKYIDGLFINKHTTKELLQIWFEQFKKK
jgi:hypothetical protein